LDMLSTNQLDPSSPLQRKIIIDLRQEGQLTYTDLKPDGVEGNAFNYHLKSLVKSGLVSHDESTYELTPDGLVISDMYSKDKLRVQPRPHFYVYVLVRCDDLILTYTPTRQPGVGICLIPSGKLHFSDDFKTGIVRELTRRGGPEDLEVIDSFPINLKHYRADQLTGQRAGAVFVVKLKEKFETEDWGSGTSEWVNMEEIKSKQKYSYINSIINRQGEISIHS
jgi:hypothetical protein